MVSDELTPSFRRFSQTIYQKPGVAKALIELQDTHGCDVNWLLFCCYCAVHRNHPLAVETFAKGQGLTEHWRTQVITMLRRVRRGIRDESCLATLTVRENVRTMVLEAEVESELVMQDALESLVDERLVDEGPTAHERLRLSCHNIRTYFNFSHLRSAPETFENLAVLLQAVFDWGNHRDISSAWLDEGLSK